MKFSKWGAWLAAAVVGSANAASGNTPITGIWEINGTFSSGGPFSTVHMKAFLTDPNDGSPLIQNVMEFDLNGTSWLGRGTFIVENLAGNQRFRGTFRQQSMPDGSTQTFEVFFRFLWNLNTHQPMTQNVVSILSSSAFSSSFSGTSNATWTVAAPTPAIPEPGTLAMMALGAATVGALARRSNRRRAAEQLA